MWRRKSGNPIECSLAGPLCHIFSLATYRIRFFGVMVSLRRWNAPLGALHLAPAGPETRSRASSAIRCCTVHTHSDPCVSVMFLNYGSMTRPPPSLLPGSDGTRSPAFQRYYEAAKTTGLVLRHSVRHVAPQYLGLISLLRSPSRGNRRASARMLFNRSHPLHSGVLFPRTPSVLPSSLRTLLAFAVLLDSGRSPAPDPIRRWGVVPVNCYLKDTRRL